MALAHEFNTDVLLYRLNQRVELPANISADEALEIRSGVQDRNDDHHVYRKTLTDILSIQCGIPKVSVYVADLRKKKDFHDRRITFTLIDQTNGTSEKVVFEMSGGISNLMNREYESTVTMYLVGQYGH